MILRFSFTLLFLSLISFGFSQEEKQEYKKRVLKSTEISWISSYYEQDGDHAAVTGGIGTEELTDAASDISVSIPVKMDGVLTIDGSVSAYTSASSSNLNPFTGASGGYDDDDDDDDDDDHHNVGSGQTTGSPWYASTGASRKDVWYSGNLSYSHSSDSRNEIFSFNVSAANEYDYFSTGGGVGFAKLWNDKNTELNLKANLYLDHWRPEYPTEIHTYVETGGNLFADFFDGVNILDQAGIPIDKSSPNAWRPTRTTLVDTKKRNTYFASLGFSQIINEKSQFSIFSDIIYQEGWLANPMQRVYFSDRDNFYIGFASDINNYENPSNREVFQLADDIERLPSTRLKIPIGTRFNYYINQNLVLRTYYRYYQDDWDIRSNTFEIGLPIQASDKFTFYPSYRFYNQTESKYFAPFEEHLSTETFYTSDYDLSKFSDNQFGFGVKYTDWLMNGHIGKLGLKDASLNYAYFTRSNNLNAQIITLGFNFAVDN